MSRPPWTSLAVIAAFVATMTGDQLASIVTVSIAALLAACDFAAWVTGGDHR